MYDSNSISHYQMLLQFLLNNSHRKLGHRLGRNSSHLTKKFRRQVQKRGNTSLLQKRLTMMMRRKKLTHKNNSIRLTNTHAKLFESMFFPLTQCIYVRTYVAVLFLALYSIDIMYCYVLMHPVPFIYLSM